MKSDLKNPTISQQLPYLSGKSSCLRLASTERRCLNTICRKVSSSMKVLQRPIKMRMKFKRKPQEIVQNLKRQLISLKVERFNDQMKYPHIQTTWIP